MRIVNFKITLYYLSVYSAANDLSSLDSQSSSLEFISPNNQVHKIEFNDSFDEINESISRLVQLTFGLVITHPDLIQKSQTPINCHLLSNAKFMLLIYESFKSIQSYAKQGNTLSTSSWEELILDFNKVFYNQQNLGMKEILSLIYCMRLSNLDESLFLLLHSDIQKLLNFTHKIYCFLHSYKNQNPSPKLPSAMAN